MIQIDTGRATLGTQDTNRHWPGNIGYTRYKQTLAWQQWEHKIKTDTELGTFDTKKTNNTVANRKKKKKKIPFFLPY
jgi:hypothetical protein